MPETPGPPAPLPAKDHPCPYALCSRKAKPAACTSMAANKDNTIAPAKAFLAPNPIKYLHSFQQMVILNPSNDNETLENSAYKGRFAPDMLRQCNNRPVKISKTF